MMNAVIETLMRVVAELAIALIGVAGAWAMAQIGKSKKLSNIAAAMQEVINLAITTVGELEQTTVQHLKESNGGKLSEEQIAALGKALMEKVFVQMSAPTESLLEAAGVDIVSLIRAAAEDRIHDMRLFNTPIEEAEPKHTDAIGFEVEE